MRSNVFALSLSALSLLLGVTSAAAPHARPLRRHQTVHADAKDTAVEVNVTSRTLERRFDGARFTFFAVGLGACGKNNVPSDFVVALNSAQYAGGTHCFDTITITVGSKSTSAQIVDECPGCPFAGLDFSSSLFDFFAPESVGVLTGSWVFGAGAAPAPSPTPSPKPTTHHTTPPPSTTATPTHTTTSHSSTHSVTSSSSVAITTSQSATSSTAAAGRVLLIHLLSATSDNCISHISK
ncbi:hypothetical protein CPB84DRAFT_1843275 [Gymnopilus junonius]|uniref:Uncharacterized protein n=1 Tax=Gymnopilus junonius TaxID=109634 RepID=A0A9P5NYK2_GYMJU|nr:hypothetical protein CPB84DRAFT_1843275 [Gymnopilus junonius]